jgi:hypothetical protein
LKLMNVVICTKKLAYYTQESKMQFGSIRTPYHQMHISLVYRSIDRKLFRDQYCIECGHPFMAISDKYVAILDSTTPTETLRENERVIETRCKFHTCKQYYKVFV